jgi:hypothetical protein
MWHYIPEDINLHVSSFCSMACDNLIHTVIIKKRHYTRVDKSVSTCHYCSIIISPDAPTIYMKLQILFTKIQHTDIIYI